MSVWLLQGQLGDGGRWERSCRQRAVSPSLGEDGAEQMSTRGRRVQTGLQSQDSGDERKKKKPVKRTEGGGKKGVLKATERAVKHLPRKLALSR